jgi:hypothetical protein
MEEMCETWMLERDVWKILYPNMPEKARRRYETTEK